MRILLTRSRDDADRSRADLESGGHTVVVAPVIEIVPLEVTWPDGVFDGVVATSAHAFDVQFRTALPTAEVRRLMPLWLVGQRTEHGARSNAFAGSAVVAPDAATLGDQIQALPAGPRRLVYLAGRNRKPALESMLPGLVVLDCYDARPAEALSPAAIAALRLGHIDIVLHYSRRSAELFLLLCMQAGLPYRPLQHACLSRDVAAPLLAAGCSRVRIAEEPTETALVATLN